MAPGANHCPTLHSLTAFEALPDEFKEIFTEAKPQAYADLIAAYKAADDKWIPIFDQHGLERTDYWEAQLDDLRKVGAVPVWEEWVKEMGTKDIPGQELLDLVLDRKSAG